MKIESTDEEQNKGEEEEKLIKTPPTPKHISIAKEFAITPSYIEATNKIIEMISPITKMTFEVPKVFSDTALQSINDANLVVAKTAFDAIQAINLPITRFNEQVSAILEPFRKELFSIQNLSVNLTKNLYLGFEYQKVSKKKYTGTKDEISSVSEHLSIETTTSLILKGETYTELELLNIIDENSKLNKTVDNQHHTIKVLINSLKTGEFNFSNDELLIIQDGKASFFDINTIVVERTKVKFTRFNKSIKVKYSSIEHNLLSILWDFRINGEEQILIDDIIDKVDSNIKEYDTDTYRRQYYDASLRINTKAKKEFEIDYNLVENSGNTFWLNEKYFDNS